MIRDPGNCFSFLFFNPRRVLPLVPLNGLRYRAERWADTRKAVPWLTLHELTNTAASRIPDGSGKQRSGFWSPPRTPSEEGRGAPFLRLPPGEAGQPRSPTCPRSLRSRWEPTTETVLSARRGNTRSDRMPEITTADPEPGPGQT